MWIAAAILAGIFAAHLMLSRRLWVTALKRISFLLDFISGEWLLAYRPNGGTVIALRTFFIAFEFVLCYWTARLLLGETEVAVSVLLKAFAAGSAAVYAALYARFASQWSYLANFYNKIVEFEIKAGADERESDHFKGWVAGFIEDAVCLHLATKPMFSPAIHHWLTTDAGVAEAFKENTINGVKEYEELIARLEEAMNCKCGGLVQQQALEADVKG